ncbi:hypothetical protein A2797_00595 [candidate division WWE3 bacterium RIFCSPHIGHO2_01_FULL_48_15]|uniref:Uncharacterized protein n=1 Tax=candidate division WWE3 bacterium RIFCSPHIGHO2_01_FULL_48_15 TaxID=1802619 RepID=A0A1F4VBU9_UNCKA|nr:MAG: hypothetical protein A2797_00595 [candidate division WWE3 bacterium RIFCSPHIGHO2_01_FULL_48_15]
MILSPTRGGWRDIVRHLTAMPPEDSNDWRPEDQAKERARRDEAIRQYIKERDGSSVGSPTEA